MRVHADLPHLHAHVAPSLSSSGTLPLRPGGELGDRYPAAAATAERVRLAAPGRTLGSAGFLYRRSSSDDTTTDTDDAAMASPANCGGRARPSPGMNMPVASAMPTQLYTCGVRGRGRGGMAMRGGRG